MHPPSTQQTRLRLILLVKNVSKCPKNYMLNSVNSDYVFRPRKIKINLKLQWTRSDTIKDVLEQARGGWVKLCSEDLNKTQ
jgi:hypothetical protein